MSSKIKFFKLTDGNPGDLVIDLNEISEIILIDKNGVVSKICSESEEEEGEVGINIIDIVQGKKSLDHMLTDDQKRYLQSRKGKSFNIMISDYKPFLHFRFAKLKKINSDDIKKM